MIRNAFQRFMYGRYGNDQLNIFLMVLYAVLFLIETLTRSAILYYLSLVPILWALFRLLSRDLDRRRAENVRFMSVADPVLRWFHLQRTIRRDKEHRYFKCPNCGQQLRVPRGKGLITITCRSCGASFQEKS